MSEHRLGKTIIFLIPVLFIFCTLYTRGITTNVVPCDLSAWEVDPPGPKMQLNDISEGFMRKSAQRPFPIFYSLATSSLYVPYIWMRTSLMPPYNLDEFRGTHHKVIEELIILDRAVNTLAALGIIILLFYSFLILTDSPWGALFVSISAALNANLMFQASVTYYETWTLFWVFLTFFCFVRFWKSPGNNLPWLVLFFIAAALAVSSHERASGYFILTVPAVIFRLWWSNRNKPSGNKKTAKYILVALLAGLLFFCLANNCFLAGIKPIFDYLHFKSQAVTSNERLAGVIPFLKNQIGCHGHSMRLIFWNLGFLTPVFSLIGMWLAWGKKRWSQLALLLFFIGYQILSIGLPGWTSGRYVLGQSLFFSFFAGLGILWLFNKNRTAALIIVCLALFIQAFVAVSVKIADTYYHPHRILESLVGEDGVRKISSKNFGALPVEWCKSRNIECAAEGSMNPGKDIEFLVADYPACEFKDASIKKEITRDPPLWLRDLLDSRHCYLHSQGPETVHIKYYSK